MGCVASTAKRRRKQAKMGYTHMAKRKRPRYSKSASSAGGGTNSSYAGKQK
jgi:hypothetical protein